VKERGSFEAVQSFFSRPAVLKGLGFIVGAAALVGAIFFLLERNINPKLFSMKSRPGKLLEAFIVGLLFVTRGPIRFYEFKTLHDGCVHPRSWTTSKRSWRRWLAPGPSHAREIRCGSSETTTRPCCD
jgi:hypothetical protein